MKITASTILTGALLAALTLTAPAQKGVETGTPFGRGDDSLRCLRNTSLYSTYYDNKDYNMAVQFWRAGIQRMPRLIKKHLYQG